MGIEDGKFKPGGPEIPASDQDSGGKPDTVTKPVADADAGVVAGEIKGMAADELLLKDLEFLAKEFVATITFNKYDEVVVSFIVPNQRIIPDIQGRIEAIFEARGVFGKVKESSLPNLSDSDITMLEYSFGQGEIGYQGKKVKGVVVSIRTGEAKTPEQKGWGLVDHFKSLPKSNKPSISVEGDTMEVSYSCDTRSDLWHQRAVALEVVKQFGFGNQFTHGGDANFEIILPAAIDGVKKVEFTFGAGGA